MTVQYATCIGEYSPSSNMTPIELFPAAVEEVFNRLNCIAVDESLYEVGEVRPTKDNIDWAKRVLLRVIPRHYLIGAEIDPFSGEIHVTWEKGPKRVVAFLPAPDQLKLYYEHQTEEGAVEHHMISGDDPWVINGVLKWLYK